MSLTCINGFSGVNSKRFRYFFQINSIDIYFNKLKISWFVIEFVIKYSEKVEK